MYKFFQREAFLNIAILVVFIPTIFYLVFLIFGSVFLSFLSIFFVLFLRWILFGGNLKRRKKLVEIVSNGFKLTDDDPFMDEKNGSVKWHKGIGYIGEVNQPMWVRVDEHGVVLFYLCLSRQPPFLIPWKELFKICISKKYLNDEGELLCRLLLDGVSPNVMVPWLEEFTQFVPERIGLEKD